MSASISSKALRETSEWCRLWWSEAADSVAPRVLLIGDSITAGYSKTVIDRLKHRAHVDYLATSRSLSDPALMKELAYMLGEYPYQVIHLNNGLHGWHLDPDAYGENLGRLVAFISEHCPKAKLIWANSTPVTCENEPAKLHPEKNPSVVHRNLVAADVMTSLGIPINDLYRVVEHRPDIRVADGLHYEFAGQVLLGDAVADQLLAALDSAT